MSEDASPARREVLWPVYVVLLGLIAAFTFVAWRNDRLSTPSIERKEAGTMRVSMELLSPTVAVDKDYKSSEEPRFNHLTV
jgi:hypothetical protein